MDRSCCRLSLHVLLGWPPCDVQARRVSPPSPTTSALHHHVLPPQGIRITRAAHGGSPGPAQTAEDLNSEAQAKAEKTMGDEEGAYPKGGSIGGVMHPPEAEVAPKPAGSMVRSDAAAAASVASAAVVEGVQAPEM